MRDHSKHVQFTREECIAKLVEISDFSPRSETVDIHDALGRVTAADCPSLHDLPTALCARLDGIAVRFSDFADGAPDMSGWELGREYDWANTGTALPAGYDTAIAIEQVVFDGERIAGVNKVPAEPGELCKPVGSDYAKGQLVVPARTRLTPTRVSALAMCGYAQVEVLARPRVVFIPTGDELVEIGSELASGKAYETNGILLAGKLRLWGAEPIVYPCLPDDWDQIRAALLRAAGEADIVCVNAGSSKGSKDFTMEILEEIGEVYCHETNHGPGHHTSASSIDGVPVLGLSGPPNGCDITADWYLKPLVDNFLYGAERGFARAKARCTEELAPQGKPKGPGPKGKEPKGDFFTIRPVAVAFGEGGYELSLVNGGKHLSLVQLDEANAYVEKSRAELADIHAGDMVEVELRYPYTQL